MANKHTPGQILRQLRKARYETAADLAEVLGIKSSTVFGHENGSRGISPKMAERYGRVFGVKPEVILYGKEIYQHNGIEGLTSIGSVALSSVPLLECDALELFRSIRDGERPMSEKSIFAPIPLHPGNRIFAVAQPDDAMLGEGDTKIARGDHVYIDPDKKYKTGDMVAAILPGYDGLIIRKYRRTSLDENGVEAFDLVALNADYGVERDAHKRATQIVGRVIGVYHAY
jgi:plasmid maintenance system antidote protein VapI